MHPLTSALPTVGGTVSPGTALGALPLQTGGSLLGVAIVFFLLAVLAGLFGARGVAGMSMEIARILVVVFLVLAVLSLLL